MSDSKKYPFPVYATQGGGLAREVAIDKYVFVEAPPDCFGLRVGEEVPTDWDTVLATNLGTPEQDYDEPCDLDDPFWDDADEHL